MLWRETPSDSARSDGYAGASARAKRIRARVGSETAYPNRANTGPCVSVSMPQEYIPRCIHGKLYSGLGVGFSPLIVMRIIFVPGFLEMVLKLFFGIPAALSYCAHLLGRGRCMCVLVRSMVRHVLAPVLTHTCILPPDTDDGKRQLLPKPRFWLLCMAG